MNWNTNYRTFSPQKRLNIQLCPLCEKNRWKSRLQLTWTAYSPPLHQFLRIFNQSEHILTTKGCTTVEFTISVLAHANLDNLWEVPSCILLPRSPGCSVVSPRYRQIWKLKTESHNIGRIWTMRSGCVVATSLPHMLPPPASPSIKTDIYKIIKIKSNQVQCFFLPVLSLLLFILFLPKPLFYFPCFVQNKDIFLKSAFCRELRASDLPPQVALYDLLFYTFHSFIAYYWSPFIRLLLHLFFLHGSEQQTQALDCVCLTNSYLEAL